MNKYIYEFPCFCIKRRATPRSVSSPHHRVGTSQSAQSDLRRSHQWVPPRVSTTSCSQSFRSSGKSKWKPDETIKAPGLRMKSQARQDKSHNLPIISWHFCCDILCPGSTMKGSVRAEDHNGLTSWVRNGKMRLIHLAQSKFSWRSGRTQRRDCIIGKGQLIDSTIEKCFWEEIEGSKVTQKGSKNSKFKLIPRIQVEESDLQISPVCHDTHLASPKRCSPFVALDERCHHCGRSLQWSSKCSQVPITQQFKKQILWSWLMLDSFPDLKN